MNMMTMIFLCYSIFAWATLLLTSGLLRGCFVFVCSVWRIRTCALLSNILLLVYHLLTVLPMYSQDILPPQHILHAHRRRPMHILIPPVYIE